MLQRLDLRGCAGDALAGRLPRPTAARDRPDAVVREIVDAVRAEGDVAVRRYAERFDGVAPDPLRVDPAALSRALDGQPDDIRRALEAAARSISAFHDAQRPAPHETSTGGIRVRAVPIPVDRAGLYVPGGRASYPSTVLMTALVARAAAVPEIAICVPPGPDGAVADVTLAAAGVAGVDEVYAVGGAQAVAAMAYGTASVPAVDVIAGPGNVFVAIAKRLVADTVGVPAAFAGPSEIVILADDTAPPELAAIDLMVQAEHGPDGLSWLIAWDEAVLDAVDAAVEVQVTQAPRRADIEATFAHNGYAALVEGPEQALAVANLIAPEHLQLMVADAETLVGGVRHAGAVFLGAMAPASLGDYIAGPSHVLPTDGTARFASALTVADFTKDVHIVSVDETGLDDVADHVIVLAEAEGLDAHARSIRMRRNP